MGDGDEGPEERPATLANELVGEAKKILGRATGDEQLAEEGKEQAEIASEVHEEYVAETHSDKHPG